MRQSTDRNTARLLTGMSHADAKDLPAEAQEILWHDQPGGTLVIWKDERPLAVLLIFPSVPTSDAQGVKGLSSLVRLDELLIARKSKNPRRRRS
jgi:hypothetical protein